MTCLGSQNSVILIPNGLVFTYSTLPESLSFHSIHKALALQPLVFHICVYIEEKFINTVLCLQSLVRRRILKGQEFKVKLEQLKYELACHKQWSLSFCFRLSFQDTLKGCTPYRFIINIFQQSDYSLRAVQYLCLYPNYMF